MEDQTPGKMRKQESEGKRKGRVLGCSPIVVLPFHSFVSLLRGSHDLFQVCFYLKTVADLTSSFC